MRRKRVIRKAFATLSVFLALLLACGIAFPSQARAEEAEIETRPIIAHNAVVLVLDDSGSMSGSPTERLREAAKKFSEKILEVDKGAKIAIVTFSDSTETLPFTSNIDDVRSFVDSKMRANGGTDVTLGLEGADTTAKSLQDSAFDGYAKSIVTMSDGAPNDDDSAIQQARSMFPNYNMYSVGFFYDGDNAEAAKFLKSIQNSGYFEANDLDALIKKFLKIVDELRVPVVISLSHEYTKGTTDKRSFTLRAEISNPTQRMVKNLKVTLRLPKDLTLQKDSPEKTCEYTHDKLDAGERIGNLDDKHPDKGALVWKVKASDSATGPFVYSVTASGANIVSLTQSDKITLDIQNGKDNQFIFGRDNWSFGNDINNFGGFGIGKVGIPARYFLNEHDHNALFTGLTNSTRQHLEPKIGSWTGSCYGFAVSSILNKMGIASPLRRQATATCLYDMKPTPDVQSYINYYHLTQFFPGVFDLRNREEKENGNKTAQEKIDTVVKLQKRVELVAKGNSPVVLTIGFSTGGGHAVVADKYESKNFESNGVSYNGRIRYYDNEHPNEEERYVYINSKTGAWSVAGDENKASSSKDNASIGFYDILVMNMRDMAISRGNYAAFLTAMEDAERSNASLKCKDKTLSIATIADGRSELSYWYDLCGGSDSPLNIALPDNKEDYSVSSPDAYDYSLKYPDAFLLVQSAGAESASFERGGTVKLAHNTGSYKLTSTLDSATGDLYTFGVKGTDGGDVELRKTEGGYVIKADSLKGATAEANGDDVTKSITLDGDATEVQISSDGTDITASIDEDGDGIFEKAIGSSAQNGKQGQGGNHGKDDSHGRDDQRQDGKAKDDQRQDGKAKDDQRQDGKAKDDNHGRDDQGQRAKQGKDDNKQNKGDDGTPGPTDQGSKVSSTFNGNAGSARVSDVQPERGGGDLPKTGDSSPLFMVLPLAVLGALATVLGIVLRRRRGDADSGGVDG